MSILKNFALNNFVIISLYGLQFVPGYLCVWVSEQNFSEDKNSIQVELELGFGLR